VIWFIKVNTPSV